MNASETSNAIEVRQLRKHFSGFDLGPLDLNIPRGSIYGFVGPNGSGKTTTLDLLFGMGTPDGGEMKVAGCDCLREGLAMKRRAAYVGTDLFYAPWGRVWKAIRFVRGFYPNRWNDETCRRLLHRFGIGEQDRITELSFGNRTKLCLILALSWHPDVLVLDEPTTGLDAISKQDLFAELLEMVQDSDRSILISSHNLADIERFADQLGIIREGTLLHEGPTSDIVDRYRLVDVSLPESVEFPKTEGLTLIARKNQQCRILVDQKLVSVDSLESRGLTSLHQSPLTLEDLFVALLKSEPVAA